MSRDPWTKKLEIYLCIDYDIEEHYKRVYSMDQGIL